MSSEPDDSMTGEAAERPSEREAAGVSPAPGVSELLVSLALAAHRFAVYPPDHPSLDDAAEAAVRSASRVLQERGSLGIGVREGALAVDGHPVDRTNALFTDLARRIEEHRVGAVVLRRGVTVSEIGGVLDALSRESYPPESALGLLPVHERPAWEHVLLQPVGYEFLHVGGGAEDPANGGGSLSELEGALEGAIVSDEKSATVAWLSRLIEELGWDRSDDAEIARERLRERVETFEPEEWGARILAAERDAGTGGRSAVDGVRRPGPGERLAIAMSRTQLPLPVTARLSVALAGLPGGPVSPILARSIERLRTLAHSSPEPGTGAEARAAVRGILERSVVLRAEVRTELEPALWTGGGGAGSDRISGPRTPLSRSEAVRVLRLSFQVDRGGAILRRALVRLVRSGDLAEVLELLELAPAESRVAGEVEESLFTPERLRHLLSGEDVEVSSLEAMVNRMGDGALDPLFDRLAGSESRPIRRKIFDRLTAMGDRVSGTVMHYLEDPPWFVQRNMLALLQRMPTLPTGFSPLQHLDHEDARVRREALPLALRVRGARDEALKRALEDSDERIVRMALLELQDAVPEGVVSVLIRRGVESPRFPQLASLAIRALGRCRIPDARDALVRQCVDTHDDRGVDAADDEPVALRPRDPSVLAALFALAAEWPEDPEVRPVLTAARASGDPQLRRAAMPPDAMEGP